MEEIFIWYFEQKGVDNPERFLGVNGVNEPNKNLLEAISQIDPQIMQSIAEKLSQSNKMKPAGIEDIISGLKKNKRKEKADEV